MSICCVYLLEVIHQSLSNEYQQHIFYGKKKNIVKLLPASVAQLDAPSDWRPGGHGLIPQPRSATFFHRD